MTETLAVRAAKLRAAITTRDITPSQEMCESLLLQGDIEEAMRAEIERHNAIFKPLVDRKAELIKAREKFAI